MIDFDIIRLTKESVTAPFDCGNSDINNFLVDDARDYQEGLLAVTYLAVNKAHDEVLSYFCLLNDKACLSTWRRQTGLEQTQS